MPVHRVAVVGSGPAGFYTSKYILRAIPQARIDMFDKLPTPFGLVRSGVAPDHPEVKNVIDDFTASVANSPQFRFRGNVKIGESLRRCSENNPPHDFYAHISVAELQKQYDAVVLATGAQRGRRLNLPSMHGALPQTATDAWSFVRWYNGYPVLKTPQNTSNTKNEKEEEKDQIWTWPFTKQQKVSRVAVLGMGNVALDCARILLGCESPTLASSDIVETARQSIVNASVQRVEVIGRRGAVQSMAGTKEIRELTTIGSEGKNYISVVDPKELELSLNAASKEEVEMLRAKKRALKIFEDMANAYPGNDHPHGHHDDDDVERKRILQLRFLLNPVRREGNELILERTRLEGPPMDQKCINIQGEEVRVGADLVIESVGFAFDCALGADAHGQSLHGPMSASHVGGKVGDRLYVAGWLKRGPTGNIASNVSDAAETATSVIRDLQQSSAKNGRCNGTTTGEERDPLDAFPGLSEKRMMSFEQWERVEKEEGERGRRLNKKAEKMTDVEEIMAMVGKK